MCDCTRQSPVKKTNLFFWWSILAKRKALFCVKCGESWLSSVLQALVSALCNQNRDYSTTRVRINRIGTVGSVAPARMATKGSRHKFTELIWWFTCYSLSQNFSLNDSCVVFCPVGLTTRFCTLFLSSHVSSQYSVNSSIMFVLAAAGWLFCVRQECSTRLTHACIWGMLMGFRRWSWTSDNKCLKISDR